MILQGLKPRIYNDLNKFGKRWIKELPSVVWSLRMTPSRATGFSPFFLVYGATPEGFGPEASKWETWYFGCDKTPEGATSLLLPRKGPSSSPRF
jgi:hypothetical protein